MRLIDKYQTYVCPYLCLWNCLCLRQSSCVEGHLDSEAGHDQWLLVIICCTDVPIHRRPLWWHALLVQIIIIYCGLHLTTVIKSDICFVNIFPIYGTEKLIFGWVRWHKDNLVYLRVSHDLILYMLISHFKIVALPPWTTKTTTHRMWSRGDGHNLNNP